MPGSIPDANRGEVAGLVVDKDGHIFKMLRATDAAYPRKRDHRRPESTLLVPKSPNVVVQQYRLKHTEKLTPSA
jgi:hypothetical protein